MSEDMSTRKLRRFSFRSIPRKWRLGVVAGAAVAALAAAPLASAQAEGGADPDTQRADTAAETAQDRPDFQMPFACGETWNGNTRQNHSPLESIDFNGSGINGEPVVASAPGTVHLIEDRGGESYGKVVFLEHDNGWYTTYAHLTDWSVSEGDSVDYGTVIGTVGSTGNSTGPHLHFEQRTGGHLGNVEEIFLDGEKVHYYGDQNYTSANGCGDGENPNPYTPEEVCGDGYAELDSQELVADDETVGEVHLLHNSDSGESCVATMKHTDVGTETATAATLEVEDGDRVTDSGDFSYYAGPTVAEPGESCVMWGGSIGDVEFESDWEHCA